MGLKETYQEKMAAQLKEWAAKMEELKARAAKATAEGRAEINKQLETLRPKMEAGQQKLKELQAASGDAWDKVKESAEKDLEKFKKIWASVKSKFD